jgi:hypothetical protein
MHAGQGSASRTALPLSLAIAPRHALLLSQCIISAAASSCQHMNVNTTLTTPGLPICLIRSTAFCISSYPAAPFCAPLNDHLTRHLATATVVACTVLSANTRLAAWHATYCMHACPMPNTRSATGLHGTAPTRTILVAAPVLLVEQEWYATDRPALRFQA